LNESWKELGKGYNTFWKKLTGKTNCRAEGCSEMELGGEIRTSRNIEHTVHGWYRIM